MSGIELISAAAMAEATAGAITTAVTLGDAFTVVGAVTSGLGALSAGQAQSDMAEYNAAVAANQAIAAQQSAAFDEEQHRAKLAKLISTQKANAGASGIDPNTGSPLSVMADTAEQGELDALAIRYGGQVGASRATSQATLDKMQAKAARIGGYYGAGTSLLTGASRLGRRGLLSDLAIA